MLYFCKYFKFALKNLTKSVTIASGGVLMKTIFTERLRARREALNLSKAQLARVSDLHRSSINHYEDGVRIPPVDIAVKLAQGLGVSLDWLVGNDTIKNEYEHIPVVNHPSLSTLILDDSVILDEECPSAYLNTNFCYIVKDDSMIGSRIAENDHICIRYTNQVKNGQIALVKHRKEGFILRRVLFENKIMTLRAANSAYEDIVIRPNNSGNYSNVKVVGTLMLKYV